MCGYVDGPSIQALGTFTGPNGEFGDVKNRLRRIDLELDGIKRLPVAACKVICLNRDVRITTQPFQGMLCVGQGRYFPRCTVPPYSGFVLQVFWASCR